MEKGKVLLKALELGNSLEAIVVDFLDTSSVKNGSVDILQAQVVFVTSDFLDSREPSSALQAMHFMLTPTIGFSKQQWLQINELHGLRADYHLDDTTDFEEFYWHLVQLIQQLPHVPTFTWTKQSAELPKEIRKRLHLNAPNVDLLSFQQVLAKLMLPHIGPLLEKLPKALDLDLTTTYEHVTGYPTDKSMLEYGSRARQLAEIIKRYSLDDKDQIAIILARAIRQAQVDDILNSLSSIVQKMYVKRGARNLQVDIALNELPPSNEDLFNFNSREDLDMLTRRVFQEAYKNSML